MNNDYINKILHQHLTTYAGCYNAFIHFVVILYYKKSMVTFGFMSFENKHIFPIIVTIVTIYYNNKVTLC